MTLDRRAFLVTPAAAATAAQQNTAGITVDLTPQFEISPTLYMQFMEPLGVTDSSCEAAWDYEKDDWRQDLIDVVHDLAPGMVRFGGNYSRYYKWREGVGPAAKRPLMINYDWGGKETNRVGTAEFADFCKRVGNAEPMYCVNFLSDGHKAFWKTTHEGNRSGDANEAADWVSYCNDPSDKLRLSHGRKEPYNFRYWQIGNETSYSDRGFPRDEAIRHTIDFAKAMRARDPKLILIGWGDREQGRDETLWAGRMAQRAGEHLDMIAIHLMGQRPTRKDTVLAGNKYQYAPEQAWAEMLELAGNVDQRLRTLEQAVGSVSKRLNLAVTEGHLTLMPHNANSVLLEWLSAAYHARSMNAYQRHGAKVKIATLADFFGNRWTVNAVMIPVPRGKSYLTPAGVVMRLFGRHNGKNGVDVTNAPSSLDIAASTTGNKLFLHVLNQDYRRPVTAAIRAAGRRVTGGRVFEIAPENPREYVSNEQPKAFAPVEKPLPKEGTWTFPARSVSALEVDLA
ncbi:MAG TPA: alpha-L-arabinofuranosidase C-terminal domain-containing protein [Bryobacteraceae bacterium]|nr:alpha-L-arabinofuranosidase C-terminal domain-containing protein [Bryobacteraceae bacterium]